MPCNLCLSLLVSNSESTLFVICCHTCSGTCKNDVNWLNHLKIEFWSAQSSLNLIMLPSNITSIALPSTTLLFLFNFYILRRFSKILGGNFHFLKFRLFAVFCEQTWADRWQTCNGHLDVFLFRCYLLFIHSIRRGHSTFLIPINFSPKCNDELKVQGHGDDGDCPCLFCFLLKLLCLLWSKRRSRTTAMKFNSLCASTDEFLLFFFHISLLLSFLLLSVQLYFLYGLILFSNLICNYDSAINPPHYVFLFCRLQNSFVPVIWSVW